MLPDQPQIHNMQTGTLPLLAYPQTRIWPFWRSEICYFLDRHIGELQGASWETQGLQPEESQSWQLINKVACFVFLAAIPWPQQSITLIIKSCMFDDFSKILKLLEQYPPLPGAIGKTNRRYKYMNRWISIKKTTNYFTSCRCEHQFPPTMPFQKTLPLFPVPINRHVLHTWPYSMTNWPFQCINPLLMGHPSTGQCSIPHGLAGHFIIPIINGLTSHFQYSLCMDWLVSMVPNSLIITFIAYGLAGHVLYPLLTRWPAVGYNPC